MEIIRRKFLHLAAASLAASVVNKFASAQAWPAKPIHAIVPIGPGTGIDIASRLALNELSVQLGQSIVIENKPSAGGTIGASLVAKAPPDGYTLLTESSTHTFVPYIYARLPYDPLRDLVPVAPLASMPLVLVCAPSKGIHSIHELVAAAKAKPGSLSYASGGVGTTTHLSVERLQVSAGFRAVHVPYRSGNYGADLISGRIDFGYTPLGSILELIQDGRLLALALSARTRSAILPGVPTSLEAGYENSEFNFYVAMFAPAATPREIVERLNRATTSAIAKPSAREQLAKIGAEPMLMNIDEFELFLSTEYKASEALVKSIGFSPI